MTNKNLVKVIYRTPFNQPPQYDFLVKGKAYTPQFLAGAGDVHFEISEYGAASLSWMLQHDWSELKIKPLPLDFKPPVSNNLVNYGT